MGAFIGSNFGAGYAQRNLEFANNAVADSAARLSSGIRFGNGSRFGSADLAANDMLKGVVAKKSMESRALSFNLYTAQTEFSKFEGAQALVARAVEALRTLDGIGSDQDASETVDWAAAYQAEAYAMVSEAATAIGYTLATASAASKFVVTALAGGGTLGSISTAQAEDILGQVVAVRAAQGAAIASLEYQMANKETEMSFLQEAQGRFIGIDYAAESATLTKSQILQQAAAAMVAQVNQSANVILALFK